MIWTRLGFTRLLMLHSKLPYISAHDAALCAFLHAVLNENELTDTISFYLTAVAASLTPNLTTENSIYIPSRDPDCWFEDSNLVVIADNMYTLFRIHRSVLARLSDLLVDRLGTKQGHGDNTPDGCGVVCVADSARSFKGFLSLLYPGPSERAALRIQPANL